MPAMFGYLNHWATAAPPATQSQPRSDTLTTRLPRPPLNPGEGLDVCKCIVPSWHGVTLNSRRAASPLVTLVRGPDYRQGVLPQNWGGIEQHRTVTCIVLKAKADDRRKTLALSSR
ncbi:uncharacterized protein TNCV_3475611 [Trichonephila clavipes]|nr:uncharacterized protein TNCV_3475611 [Trichonephila clavipes]